MKSKKILIVISLIAALIIVSLSGVNNAMATATYGNATAADLISGKTATADAGQITGTMPNKVGSGTVITPGASDQAISRGYYGGTLTDGKVAGVVVPAANVLSGTTIAGTAGTMPNKSGGIHVLATGATAGVYSGGDPNNAYLQPPAGYYDGGSWVKSPQPDLVPANILSGKSIFGVAGTAINGTGMKRYASGSLMPSGTSVSVSGLPFTPSIVKASQWHVDIGLDMNYVIIPGRGIRVSIDGGNLSGVTSQINGSGFTFTALWSGYSVYWRAWE